MELLYRQGKSCALGNLRHYDMMERSRLRFDSIKWRSKLKVLVGRAATRIYSQRIAVLNPRSMRERIKRLSIESPYNRKHLNLFDSESFQPQMIDYTLKSIQR
jgi:hypothetical protein